MTQEDLNQLAEEHIDNEEYEVMFHDKQPLWVVNNCYQEGFKKALELVFKSIHENTNDVDGFNEHITRLEFKCFL